MNYLHHASFGIGVLGVLVIAFGVGSGFLRFGRLEFHSAQGCNVDEDRKRLRHLLGYYLLLGLEFLIAADIIDTLMKPDMQDLIALGAIVLIRTVISWSLNAELKSGRQDTAPAFLSSSADDFPVTRSNTGLESPVNRQAGKPALRV
jgi:uncharacterized membrane protein